MQGCYTREILISIQAKYYVGTFQDSPAETQNKALYAKRPYTGLLLEDTFTCKTPQDSLVRDIN